MTRRRAPRPAAEAFQAALRNAAPETKLGAVQAAWAGAVGERIAAVARPVAESDGTLTVECAEAVWAQELDLMQGSLLERLREQLGATAPKALKFRVRPEGF
jgi:predicted nucleic acid-binding Zn ribbon protein